MISQLILKTILINILSLLCLQCYSGEKIIDKKLELKQIKLFTEEYPPYNYSFNGEARGIFVDIIISLFNKLGEKRTRKDIMIRPWARGYNLVETMPNTSLFLMTMTPERKNKFKWVGPVVDVEVVLTAKKSKNIVIKNRQDLQKYRIGTVNNDVGEQILLSYKLKNLKLDKASSSITNIKKLIMDRIDFVSYDKAVTKWLLKKNKEKTTDYEVVYTLVKGQGYFAFNLKTPDSIITKLQNELNIFKKTDAFKNILKKYLE